MTRFPFLSIAIGLLSLAVASGCAVPGLRRARPSDAATAAAANAASWATTLLAAQRDVDRGRHADADRTLREFAERAPASPEAVETMYWRAMIMLDPASRAGSTREALGLLERYLASDVPLTHRTEAAVLQRLATALAASASSRAGASDADVKALKDELEQTKAELERIRKRLAPPPLPAAPPSMSPHAE